MGPSISWLWLTIGIVIGFTIPYIILVLSTINIIILIIVVAFGEVLYSDKPDDQQERMFRASRLN